MAEAENPGDTIAITLNNVAFTNDSTATWSGTGTTDELEITVTDELNSAITQTYTVNVNVLGSLTVESAAGTNTGDTALTVTPAAASGNIYKYKVADDVTAVDYDDDLSTWTTWNGSADITAASGKKITVAECTSAGKARKVGSATVVAA